MESLRNLTALLLCSILCLPTPIVAAQQAEALNQQSANTKSRENYAPNSATGQQRGDEQHDHNIGDAQIDAAELKQPVCNNVMLAHCLNLTFWEKPTLVLEPRAAQYR